MEKQTESPVVSVEPGADQQMVQERVSAMLKVLKPVSTASETLIGGARFVAMLFLLAAGALWIMICLPVGQLTVLKIALLTVFAGVLMTPGVVWFFLATGLQQVANLPSQLLAITNQGKVQLQAGVSNTVSSEGGFLKKLFAVLRSVVDLRKTGLDGKLFVVESAALLRMFNPFTFVVALATFVGGIAVVSIVFIIGIFRYVV